MASTLAIRIVERAWAPGSQRFLLLCPDLVCHEAAFPTLQHALHAVEYCLCAFPSRQRPAVSYLVRETEIVPLLALPERSAGTLTIYN